MGGLVLALIAGVLVPAGGVLLLASRDPVPRGCDTGQATPTTLEGAILYSTGADLWYSEGYPGRPRKLVDYGPRRARPNASPAASAAAPSPATVTPKPSPATVTPKPSPAATPLVAMPVRILASDISADRKLVAFLVLDPPEHKGGGISLRLVSPLDPPGTAPVEAWWVEFPDRRSRRASVHILDNGKILAFAPVQAHAVTPPTPAPAHPQASPSATATPSATAAPATTLQVLVIAPGPPRSSILASGSERYYLAEGRTAWPDARAYRVPPALPSLGSRVDGPTSRVAGVVVRDLNSPLARRRINELVLGTAASRATQAACVLPGGMTPTLFSPDESKLVLAQPDAALVMDLAGTHAASSLLLGTLLAWRS